MRVRHFELADQAMAKLARGNARELDDVQAMLDRGLVSPAGLPAFLEEIVPELCRFPAVDPGPLRRAVEAPLR